MAQFLVDLLKEKLGVAVLETHALHGDETVVVEPAAWLSACRFLRDNARCDMNMLTDLTAVDYLGREPRFEIVAHLVSLSKGHRLRIKTRVGDEDGNAEVDSLSELWASANWLEREAYDMFGVIFSGHPDLRRILLPEDWVGYPLRKDYDVRLQDVEWVRKHLGIESGQKYYVGEARAGSSDYITPTD